MQISAWKKTSNDKERVELAVRDLTDPSNTALGYNAGGNTTDSNNTAVAVGRNNTAVGLDDEIPF